MAIVKPSKLFAHWLRWSRTPIYGFFYWLVFLLVLEPGNVFRALQAGHVVAFTHEVERIFIASLLSATAMPLLVALSRRFPISGAHLWRHGLILLGVAFSLSHLLILSSCLLAAWLFAHAWLPAATEVYLQLADNWLLLFYALLAFSAIERMLHRRRPMPDEPIAVAALTPPSIRIKTRTGATRLIELSEIDWIESQGNYLALHIDTEVHLIRETLAKFELRLSGRNFVRIHRGAIIAVDRIRLVSPMANGDAIVRLRSDIELRASRRYRQAIRQHWQSDHGAP